MPKISVLVPIFNVEKYLRECLDSIVNQTLRDIEIICIDDGSTDSSPSIIKEYAEKDSRFVVITKKNSGYGDSMNKGISKATGEYIGIVESDDFIDKNMFSSLYRLAKKNDAEVVKSNFYYYYTDLSEASPQWDDNLQGIYNRENKQFIEKHDTLAKIVRPDEVGQVIDPTIKQHIFYQKPAIWSAIYSRKFLSENNIDFLASPGASYQDTAFSFKVWAMAHRVVFTEKAYLHYRQDNEASSINSPGKVFCVSDEYDEVERFLETKGLTKKLGPLAQKTKYGAYMWNYKRLADGLDEQFLKRFSQDYKNADRSAILDYFYFDINERRDLKEIISNPDKFHGRKLARKTAKVSVIVPIYNVEKYLKKCLDQLSKQTLKDIEIICVNDGSPDRSIDIIEKFYKTDPRFVIREISNSGLSAARNHGMSHASADYLMFCDSDDSFTLDACEKMYKAITKNNVDIGIAGTNIVYSTPEIAHAYERSDTDYFTVRFSGKLDIDHSLFEKTDVAVWNKIFKTSIQRKYGIWFPKGMWYEDAPFFTDYMIVSSSAYYLSKEKIYNYVRREGSIMSTTAEKTPRAIDHVRTVVEIFKFMKKYKLIDDQYPVFVRSFTNGYRLSVRHMPKSSHEKLHDYVRTFLKQNRHYLDKTDPQIAKTLHHLLPKVPHSIVVKRVIKRAIRPARGVLKISPTYRRQTHIIQMIDDLSKKVAKIDSKNEKQFNLINEQMSIIEDRLRNTKKK